jgi:hypothetical protein
MEERAVLSRIKDVDSAISFKIRPMNSRELNTEQLLQPKTQTILRRTLKN